MLRNIRMSRTRISVVIALVAGLLVATPARDGVADLVGETIGLHGAAVVPANPRNPANELVAAAVPQLSSNDEATALHLVNASKTVAALLGGAGYTIDASGPWTSGGYPNELIGEIVFVRLQHPVTVTGAWPTVTYADGQRQYREVRPRLTVVGLRRATVEVDLKRDAIVGVRPASYVEIEK